MNFLLGVLLGTITSYLIVNYIAEMKLRINYLEESLGFDKHKASKWLDTKNPGIGLNKPNQLNFKQFIDYVKSIE